MLLDTCTSLSAAHRNSGAEQRRSRGAVRCNKENLGAVTSVGNHQALAILLNAAPCRRRRCVAANHVGIFRRHRSVRALAFNLRRIRIMSSQPVFPTNRGPKSGRAPFHRCLRKHKGARAATASWGSILINNPGSY